MLFTVVAIASSTFAIRQISTSDISPQSVTGNDIAPNAVSLSTVRVQAPLVVYYAGDNCGSVAYCPSGYMVSGCGYDNTVADRNFIMVLVYQRISIGGS